DLAEIRLLLDDAAPRSDIEALQGEINELAERADESRGTDNAAAAVASIERRLTEIRDALCVLRPAENLLGMARVVQQASRKIEIIAGAWDPAVLEQLASAVAAMRGIAAQAASPEARAKLSEARGSRSGRCRIRCRKSSAPSAPSWMTRKVAPTAESCPCSRAGSPCLLTSS